MGGGVLLARSTNAPLWLAVAIAAAMVALTAAMLPAERRKVGAVEAVHQVWRRDRVFRSSFAELSAIGFPAIYAAFLMFAFALHWGFVALLEPLYAKELGFTPELIGLIYAGFSIPYLFVSVFTGRYLDRAGASGVVTFGLLCVAFSLIGFAATDDARTLFLFSLIAGIGDALLLPAVMSVFDQLSTRHAKERIAGIEVFAESAGYFAGPLIGGVATFLVGFPAAFLAAGVGFAGLALFAALVPFTPRHHVA